MLANEMKVLVLSPNQYAWFNSQTGFTGIAGIRYNPSGERIRDPEQPGKWRWFLPE